jgi:hypothetical protein
VLVEEAVFTGAQIVERTPEAEGARLRLEVWCQNEAGERVLAGEASCVRQEG